MEYEYTETDVFSDEEIYTDSDLVHLDMTADEVSSLLSTPNIDKTIADVIDGCQTIASLG